MSIARSSFYYEGRGLGAIDAEENAGTDAAACAAIRVAFWTGWRIGEVLRHNVASWDVSRGVALEIAGKNVGHRSRDATEVYAHFAPDALKRAADDRARAISTAMEEARGKNRM